MSYLRLAGDFLQRLQRRNPPVPGTLLRRSMLLPSVQLFLVWYTLVPSFLEWYGVVMIVSPPSLCWNALQLWQIFGIFQAEAEE